MLGQLIKSLAKKEKIVEVRFIKTDFVERVWLGWLLVVL